MQPFLLPEPAMTGLDPSSAGSLMIEVETAAAADAAVVRTGTFEWRLRRPGEGTLLVGEVSQLPENLVHGK